MNQHLVTQKCPEGKKTTEVHPFFFLLQDQFLYIFYIGFSYKASFCLLLNSRLTVFVTHFKKDLSEKKEILKRFIFCNMYFVADTDHALYFNLRTTLPINELIALVLSQQPVALQNTFLPMTQDLTC